MKVAVAIVLIRAALQSSPEERVRRVLAGNNTRVLYVRPDIGQAEKLNELVSTVQVDLLNQKLFSPFASHEAHKEHMGRRLLTLHWNLDPAIPRQPEVKTARPPSSSSSTMVKQ